MAQVDVSDALLDPDFVQPLMIVRRKPCVNNFGQNVLQESGEKTFGSIQPVGGKTLQRLPESLRVGNVQSFWLKKTIIADASQQYPDILVKNGVRFAVQMVFDWSDWGAGWTEGLCIQERPSL